MGRLGSLAYRVIAIKGWINLDSEDGLRARVLTRERTITSEDVSVKALRDGYFECEEWGLQIRWVSDNEVEFRLGELMCTVVIEELRPGE